ncbi:vWA domain-containing protein [Deinococcus budaensis]|uniref:VWFA domain-containing protein n=1 Tax=Deinococcus budaensis TaxID=1665626 RepID=A0A7W8GGQ5_9DEIO|nr:vWA domain-containing protein [Deinococcus budaensis]MBB5235315.1 hypothetical protein [Deinococcus budaensis]
MRPAAVTLLSALLAAGLACGPRSGARAAAPAPAETGTPGVTLRRAPAAPASPLACALPPGPLPSQTRAVFILDTSGSMRGIGDGKADIFGRVVAAVNAYVRAERPDRVELVTFDGGLRSSRGYSLPGDRTRWNSDLAALRADGQNTYLYRSVAQALAPLKAGGYVTTVLVLTDGIDNDPDPAQTAARALGAFGARGPLDTLHYVALGTAVPAEAQAALRGSGYAQSLTVPVGQAPELTGLGVGIATVTDPARVPAPFPAGTPLVLGVPGGFPVRLAGSTAQGGGVGLEVAGRVPHGTPALLCAPPATPGGLPRRVLLRLEVGPAPGLSWLNPGADRALRPGESVTLRYRLSAATDPAGLTLRLPPGLTGELLRLPGGREVGVRLTRQAPDAAGPLVPRLVFGDGQSLPLAPIVGGEGRAAPVPPPAAAPPNGARPDAADGNGPWGPLLGGLLAAGLLGGGLLLWRRRRGRAGPRPAPPVLAPPTAVEGIEYGEDRTLALVGAGGRGTAVPIPLSGPFDLGQVARVPHLSGLRAEQHRDGLRMLRVPGDLEVSQGARLLGAGDVVRPGTLLGVAVARPARSPLPPLGTLIGLGLPLRLRADGVTLHLVGPYGEHALALRPGITDVGEAVGAGALHGLKVAPSGPRVLLAAVPAGVTLRRLQDGAELRPGTYLPAETGMELPGTG